MTLPVFEYIRETGGVSVADFMRLSVETYYATQDPFGAAGDFITAPEASPFFGDMLALWVLDLWGQLGHAAVHVVELGPGRGTLMADMLRLITKQPSFNASHLHVHMVETSEKLQTQQEKALHPYAVQKTWHTGIETLPGDKPLIILANEFFDALPVQQFVHTDNGLVERKVVAVKGALKFEPAEGAVLETGLEAQRVIKALTTHIATAGGALLAIDYGFVEGRTGSTLQAVRKHKKVNVLDMAGQADLTALVNFKALQRAAESVGGTTQPVTTQRAFLKTLGIDIWVQKILAKTADVEAFHRGLNRLLDPEQMGDLFKVLCVHHKNLTPSGFGDL